MAGHHYSHLLNYSPSSNYSYIIPLPFSGCIDLWDEFNDSILHWSCWDTFAFFLECVCFLFIVELDYEQVFIYYIFYSVSSVLKVQWFFLVQGSRSTPRPLARLCGVHVYHYTLRFIIIIMGTRSCGPMRHNPSWTMGGTLQGPAEHREDPKQGDTKTGY